MNIESDPLENIGKSDQPKNETNYPQPIEEEPNVLFDDLPAQQPEIGEEEGFIDSFASNELVEEQKKRDSAFKRIFSWLRRKEVKSEGLESVIDSRLQSIRGTSDISQEAEAEQTIQPTSEEDENPDEYIPPEPVYDLEEEETFTKITSEDSPSLPEIAVPDISIEDFDISQPSFSAKPELTIPEEEPHAGAAEDIAEPATSLEDEWLDLDIDIEKVREALSKETPGETTSPVQETEPEKMPGKDESIDLTKLREAFLLHSDQKPSKQKSEDYLDTEAWVFEDLSEGKDDTLLETLEDDYTPPPPLKTSPEVDRKEAAQVDPNLIDTLEDQWLDLDLDKINIQTPPSDVLFETTGEGDKTEGTDEIGLETETAYREDKFIADESLFEEVPREVPAAPSRPPREHYSLLIEMRKGLMDDLDSPAGVSTIGPEDAYLEVPEDLAVTAAEAALEKRHKFRWVWVLIPIGAILLLAAALGIFVAVSRMNLPTPQPAVVEVSGNPTENPYESTSIYPTGIILTGGWYFELNPGVLENNVWKPKSAEWLFGSELRRVVALPWTKQLEAVVKSLEPGEQIKLAMSNNDVLIYKVEKVDKVPKNETSILSGSKASLLIILYNDYEDDRWVVICTPSISSQ